MAIEPSLQLLTGETFSYRTAITDDGARLDISANEFWDESKSRAFFDIRVFNAHAPSNCTSSSAACYRKHELEKRRGYERRVIDVEHGTFTPIVISTSGGMGPSATVAIKQLAALMSKKLASPYSKILNLICCRISYSLIDSAIMCLRGARSSTLRPIFDLQNDSPDLIASMSHVF